MTKADLVEQVYEAIGPGVTKKDCGAVVDAFLNAVKLALANGEHIEIRGFGTFKVRERRPRIARNPRTGAVDYRVSVPDDAALADIASGNSGGPDPLLGHPPHLAQLVHQVADGESFLDVLLGVELTPGVEAQGFFLHHPRGQASCLAHQTSTASP